MSVLNLLSVREQVYEYLKSMINSGELKSGDTINLNALADKFNISKTPLRDALLQLEVDGFVNILPRKGIIVSKLTLEDIKWYYEVIASAESYILEKYGNKMTGDHLDAMEKYNNSMKDALKNDNFDEYYKNNLNFHNTYINLTENKTMLKTIRVAKERLYDFPRKKEFVKDWELDSVVEHDELINLLEQKEFALAAKFIKNVHWSFEYQLKYILKYYTETE
ncbi:GntR family transcriptional regulator [Deferribacterales bacterium Es71-Z0220]|uniref:GntR family transcriptional regulator n=1 Tax=Deferrivibrio essentukiensis TaxID=2880922 RepID=UPI001F601123|nr:GntR family transcriptional regulator [Deferrivibrio essentukiensis]MCB4205344.1 GntR family transcriptional regulator [Deferrivibrio essentukiensis]